MGDIRGASHLCSAHGISLEARLREAIEEEQFVLHYQPKIDLGSGTVCGLEALMRWQDPRRGLVGPEAFIPPLEDSDLIVEVGTWAIRHALSQRLAWHIAGFRPPRIAVNISPVQLRHSDFVNTVCESIEAAGVGAPGLDLELTESALLDDMEGHSETLHAIGSRGIGISIDDCGMEQDALAGYARLPVRELKIDRPHVARMMADPDRAAAMSGLIGHAHALNLDVVAEGVETAEQLGLLRAFGCDRIQGHLVSKPQPAAEIARWLGGDEDKKHIFIK